MKIQDGGTITYPNGCIYTGNIKDGHPIEKGTISCPDGIKHARKEDAQINDALPIQYNPNKLNVYYNHIERKPVWLKECKGSQRLIDLEGNIYQGPTENGLPHESGILTDKYNKTIEAAFNDGYNLEQKSQSNTISVHGSNGNDSITDKDGVIYSGKFEESQLIDGRIIYLNGVTYKGKFKDKKLQDDNGEIIYLNGITYRGKFEDGHPVGKGTLSNLNGLTAEISDGKFKDKPVWLKEGKESRRLIDLEGNIYQGEVMNNLPHGHGVLMDKYDKKIEGKEWFKN